MVFINTILAALYYADDGQCDAYENVFDCLAPVSVDFINPLCSWDRLNRVCSFIPPGVEFFSLLFLTAVLSIVSVPMDKLTYFFVCQVKELLEESSIDKNDIKRKMHHPWINDMVKLQTPIGTLFRGTRLRYMQSEIDFVTPEVFFFFFIFIS